MGDEGAWFCLVSSFPPSIQPLLQTDYEAWAKARASCPPIMQEEELNLIRYYQHLDDSASTKGGVLLVLAVAGVLGRAANQQFFDRWYTLREAERRQALEIPKEQGALKRAIEDRLVRLNEVLKGFDTDSLSPHLRVLRAQQERKPGMKRGLTTEVAGLYSPPVIDEEMRELASRKRLLRVQVEDALKPRGDVTTVVPSAVKTRPGVLQDDISQGTWGSPPGSIKVPVVNEIDKTLPPTIQFLSSELYGQDVPLPLTDVLIGCECRSDCRSDRQCWCMHEHPLRNPPFDTYQSTGRLTLRMWHPNTSRVIYECHALCQCSHHCRNRVVQRGPTMRVELFKTKAKGWGVRAAERIPKGTFVCTYVGEIISMEEFNLRNQKEYKHLADRTYLYDLDFGLQQGEQRYMIDATAKGGVARYFNHSCDPNMENFQVHIDDVDILKPKVAFFACRDVSVGEELTFDYKINSTEKTEKCHCGASNCRVCLLRWTAFVHQDRLWATHVVRVSRGAGKGVTDSSDQLVKVAFVAQPVLLPGVCSPSL